MNRAGSYFIIQIKRVIKVLPTQLMMNFAVCVCIGALAAFFLREGVLEPEKQKFQIGVVGDTSDSYLGFGISVLQLLDDSQYMVELSAMTEEEARKKLRTEQISSFMVIPDGFSNSIVTGANNKLISCFSSTGQQGIVNMVMSKIPVIGSTTLTRAQSAVYGMQNILRDHGMNEELMDATARLNIRLIDQVLDRGKFCKREILGISNGLSTEGYYFCSVLLLFLLLAGISNVTLLVNKNVNIFCMLEARGVNAFVQILGEYLAYTGLLVCYLAEILGILAIAFQSSVLVIPEWEALGSSVLVGFGISLLPIVAMFSAMQFCVSELVNGVVSSILLQFICGIGMGYLSGFFYPIDFFPESMIKIGGIFPTGVAMKYADGSMIGAVPWGAGAGMILYTLFFLTVTIRMRKGRIQRGL